MSRISFLTTRRSIATDGPTPSTPSPHSTPSEEIVLILGADAARGIPTWERADEVLKRVQVAVLPRPGTERSDVDAAIGDPIWLDMPALPVSGTLIRERFAAGTGVRFLVTDGVYEYMVENRLYEGSTPD